MYGVHHALHVRSLSNIDITCQITIKYRYCFKEFQVALTVLFYACELRGKDYGTCLVLGGVLGGWS